MTIIRLYNDGFLTMEVCDNITSALSACAIYLEDKTCIFVTIISNCGETIFYYTRS